MSDPNITTDEVVAIFHELEPAVKQAVFIAVLQRRNGLLQVELESARRSIANYELFIKTGEEAKAIEATTEEA